MANIDVEDVLSKLELDEKVALLAGKLQVSVRNYLAPTH